MSALNPFDGGPAFPCELVNQTGRNMLVGGFPVAPGDRVDCLGMSLRDYFAAMALHAVYRPPGDHTKDAAKLAVECAAARAYEVADTMLKARKK